MKKLIIASLLAIALVFLLCSCAGTSESDTQSLVLNPFETSENENSETPVSYTHLNMLYLCGNVLL